MSLQSAPDIAINIRSENASSERRVSPSWSLSHFKGRLEPITGIPALSQRLSLNLGGSRLSVPIEAANEDVALLSNFPLQAYAEILVTDTRPPAMRTALFADPSTVEKYTMPEDEYSARPDTVLAYKRAHKLGRFDPAAPSALDAAAARTQREVDERSIALGARCRLLPPPGTAGIDADGDDRRGQVRYVGPIPELPGVGSWVGVALDEPVGRNDGSVKGGKRYFECGSSCGVFVRPERVEVGDFAVLDELGEDMQEI